MLTIDLLKKIMPRMERNPNDCAALFPHLVAAMNEAQINTELRIAAFLAQVGHESAEFKAWEENLNYSADALLKTWPKRFDSAKAAEYARKPEKIANLVYANRMDNGDEKSGDGWKYAGKGPIQLTGKQNYESCGKSLGLDLLSNPQLAATKEVGFRVAGWYWKLHKLNELADKRDFQGITKKINGGTIGQAHRDELYKKALDVFGIC